ncbi:MAG: hypothetical protein Q9162_006661 [Coniocarpon cinnabarinum]
MSAQPEEGHTSEGVAPVDKGKGKAVQQQDVEMGENDEDDEEESEEEHDVRLPALWLLKLLGFPIRAILPPRPGQGRATEEHHHDDEEESDLEEIEMDNIVGSRTRGKVIDYAKAAAEHPEEDEDDEEDDEDFEAPEDEEMAQ